MSRSMIVRWVPAVLWMGLIFYLSAQPAQQSSELSSSVMHVLLQLVENWFYVDEATFHVLVRKGAHMTAYGIMAVLVMFALGPWRIITLPAKAKVPTVMKQYISSNWRQVGWTLVICVVYAATDEVHQLFVPGRSGEVADLAIDTIGAMVGVIIYVIWKVSVYRFKKAE